MTFPDNARPARLGAKALAACAAGLLAAMAAPAQAAVTYSEHWNGGPGLGGWASASATTQVQHNDSEGLPPGALTMLFVGDGIHAPTLGVYTPGVPEMSGSYDGAPWTVSFDLRMAFGQATGLELRYYYADFSADGWRRPLPVPTDDEWTHYSFAIDATWTDDQAVAEGWQPAALRTFQQNLTTVFWVGLWINLPDDTTTAVAHLDNYVQQQATVPTPATALLAALGIAGIGALRSARPRAPA